VIGELASPSVARSGSTSLFIAMRRRGSSSDSNESNTSRSPARRSRWRPWLLLLGFSVVWKVVVLTLGAAVPRWLIDDSVDHIPLSMQPYANQARATALALWDGPIERRTLVRSVRVVSVDSARGQAAEGCGGMSARVRAYTFFAIPYSDVRTVCGSGIVEYRVFRRWNR
jgi:hypothetical protein